MYSREFECRCFVRSTKDCKFMNRSVYQTFQRELKLSKITHGQGKDFAKTICEYQNQMSRNLWENKVDSMIGIDIMNREPFYSWQDEVAVCNQGECETDLTTLPPPSSNRRFVPSILRKCQVQEKVFLRRLGWSTVLLVLRRHIFYRLLRRPQRDCLLAPDAPQRRLVLFIEIVVVRCLGDGCDHRISCPYGDSRRLLAF